MKELTIDQLNEIYTNAESADKEVFAEERSNLLLIAGEHYSKQKSFNQRVKDDKSLTENQKLRLTKNHIHKVFRHYVNQIITHSPGVTVLPHNESELQDQKNAELNKKVWTAAKQRHRLAEKVRGWVENFIGIGAVSVKIFYDPNAGDFLGWEPNYYTDDQGEPHLDEMGQPMPIVDENGAMEADKGKPVFSGDFVFENIFDFNLLMHASAIEPGDAPCFINRKMVSLDELKDKYAGDDEKLGFLQENKDETFIVFDSTKNSYERSKNQALIKEYFFKPSYNYPNGYFYITTSFGVLEEGELPYGVFPIPYAGFDTHPTSRRARAIIKVARPFQAEINRASSAVATHQVTLGDDKVIYQLGTKLSQGALLPGVRGIQFQGAPPQMLPGRDGSQYLPYIQAQITEMYDVLMMDEEAQEKQNGQLDPYALLFRSIKQQKKYAQYAEKFNQFLCDVCETYLTLAKYHLSDEQLLYAIGKSEQVNIPEFRSTTKLCYQIKVEEQDETIETQLGKQLTLNHILQYASAQLKPEDIGKVMRAMPFGNVEEAFDDLTINYDNVVNDMLALERGENPEAKDFEDHPYIINKLTHRTKQADFRFLPPQVQQNYQAKIQAHISMEAIRQQKIQAAEAGFVPTDGALITCDMYMPTDDPTKPGKRVRLPYASINWLIKILETQGKDMHTLEDMNQGALANLADQLITGQSAQSNLGGPRVSNSGQVPGMAHAPMPPQMHPPSGPPMQTANQILNH